ncbi:uncharacterized protein LOC128195536 isoform X2 [Vigna angularis]|uniref:uncharacterized protein LOC128195536 isoform X2 n=1 Tax=Phaseolus angularis TaxID=3914 RepID=UPI0022B31E4A|nr:uncharacterized protein LOC128195536 isoform X2 [Vigna angularis]
MRSRRGSVHAMLGLGLIEKSRTPWVPFNRRVILLILLPTCKWLVQKLFHPESFVELVNQSIEIVGRVIMEKQVITEVYVTNEEMITEIVKEALVGHHNARVKKNLQR